MGADIDAQVGKFKNLVSSTVKDDGKRLGANLPKPRPKISLGDFLSVKNDDDDKKVRKPRARSPPPVEKSDVDEFKDLDDEEAELLRAFKRKSNDISEPILNKQ